MYNNSFNKVNCKQYSSGMLTNLEAFYRLARTTPSENVFFFLIAIHMLYVTWS